MSVQTYEPQPIASQLAPTSEVARWIAVLPAAAQLADKICNTEFVPRAMRGKPDVIAAAVLYGDEIGVGPMQALAAISVVEGRPSPSAELMRALIFREGHEIRISELTGVVCTIEGRRAGSETWTSITWTIDMARTAGLLNKANWKNYPRAMLLARCSSELARILFPDVIKGLGHVADDPETVGEFDAWAETIAPTPAEPKTIERRRRGNAQAVADNLNDARTAEAEQDSYQRHPQESSPATATLPRAPQPLQDLPPVTPPPRQDPPRAPVGLDKSSGDTSTQTPPSRVPGDAPSDGQDALPLDVGGALPEPDEQQAKPLGSNTLRAVMGAFKRIDVEDRDLRLAITSAIVKRPISTTNELSFKEASAVIRTLGDLEVGALTLRIDEYGHVAILGTPNEGN